ncbi:hypothetical protein GGTG_13038 [Gaeumannomyces tritici R3-111a-1]|uniref:Uncharacterized protein n=1 Tax=Gaeumannomyces tritici (strain R3-111a-1) TaxID=644352 RepID=J3PHQ7_GAET3|nr:hypothetical protein GGTG_13038 [Gaeumannomyces tritici R3-111a-1]EJT69419.1 hypothetical protein GGTG_13038 [Gaeumannomyces tritici R3-111a-1]
MTRRYPAITSAKATASSSCSWGPARHVGQSSRRRASPAASRAAESTESTEDVVGMPSSPVVAVAVGGVVVVEVVVDRCGELPHRRINPTIPMAMLVQEPPRGPWAFLHAATGPCCSTTVGREAAWDGGVTAARSCAGGPKWQGAVAAATGSGQERSGWEESDPRAVAAHISSSSGHSDDISASAWSTMSVAAAARESP